VSSHSTPAVPVITPALCSTSGASDGGRRSRLRQARTVCRDRCLSGCRWGRHAGPLPARRRRLAAGWVLYPGLTNPTPSIRSRLFRASTRASQRENFRRSASVAPAKPAASSLKAHNGENSGGDGGSARGRTTACGQDGPDFVTRMCSRFWMGQPTCRGNTS